MKKDFQINDSVRIKNSSEKYTWSIVKIEKITRGKALISYGSPILQNQLRIYGQFELIPLEKLEHLD